MEKVAKEILKVAKELLGSEVVAGSGPFSKMDKRELKEMIELYADFAPENFWMDGEFGGSYASRLRELMRLWPRMNSRAQQLIYDDIQRWQGM